MNFRKKGRVRSLKILWSGEISVNRFIAMMAAAFFGFALYDAGLKPARPGELHFEGYKCYAPRTRKVPGVFI